MTIVSARTFARLRHDADNWLGKSASAGIDDSNYRDLDKARLTIVKDMGL